MRDAKTVAVSTLRGTLANVEDNLYRYKNFGKPTDTTGNGETFASVIQKLEAERDELRAAIEALS